MLKSCERARERYAAFLEEQRKLEERTKQAKKGEEENKQKKEVLSEINDEIGFVRKDTEVAEKSIEEGNQELGNVWWPIVIITKI